MPGPARKIALVPWDRHDAAPGDHFGVPAAQWWDNIAFT